MYIDYTVDGLLPGYAQAFTRLRGCQDNGFVSKIRVRQERLKLCESLCYRFILGGFHTKSGFCIVVEVFLWGRAQDILVVLV